jgi:hypothetical protein
MLFMPGSPDPNVADADMTTSTGAANPPVAKPMGVLTLVVWLSLLSSASAVFLRRRNTVCMTLSQIASDSPAAYSSILFASFILAVGTNLHL